MMFYKSFQEELSKGELIELKISPPGTELWESYVEAPALFVTDDDIFNDGYYDNVCSGFI